MSRVHRSPVSDRTDDRGDDVTDEETDSPADAAPTDGSRRDHRSRPVAKRAVKRSIWTRLYHGETNIDFVGRRKLWFTISAVAIVLSLGSLVTRGLNLGIDFEGGVVWEVPAERRLGRRRPRAPSSIEPAGGQRSRRWRSDEGRPSGSRPSPAATPSAADEVTDALADARRRRDRRRERQRRSGRRGARRSPRRPSGPSIFFLVAHPSTSRSGSSGRWRSPTLAALVHDILVTVGVYSLFGFEVTPATVDRLPHDPRLLALRQHRRVRQGRGEHPARVVDGRHDLQRHGQPVAEPGADASLNTSLTALLPVALAAGRRLVHPRRDHAAGVRARPARRPARRRLLVDLHRLADAGRAEGARAPLPRHPRAARRARRRRPTRRPPRRSPAARRRRRRSAAVRRRPGDASPSGARRRRGRSSRPGPARRQGAGPPS